MANIKSAKKRILQNAKRAEVNKFRLSRIRTVIKSFKSNVSGQKNDVSRKQFLQLEAEISKAASKGFIKKNTASRIVSRLSQKLKTNTK